MRFGSWIIKFLLKKNNYYRNYDICGMWDGTMNNITSSPQERGITITINCSYCINYINFLEFVFKLPLNKTLNPKVTGRKFE